MPKITCLTIAYNAEGTLCRTVDSILAQTYRDYEYILVDHGSTDCTRRLIQDYEWRYPQIRGVYFDENQGAIGILLHMIEQIKGAAGGWFITVDADDEYKPEAFQIMVGCAETQNLDMVCCGSDFIDETSGQLCGQRAVDQTLPLDTPASLSDYLPFYHAFMRTWWAKLIRMDILRKIDWSWTERDEITDTRFAFECLSRCERTLVLSGTLHRYYISGGSTFNRLAESVEGTVDLRIRGDRRINAFIKQILIEKCGRLTRRNEDFLMIVYMNSLRDLTAVLFNVQIPLANKIDALRETYVCDDVRELARHRDTLGSQFGVPGDAERCRALFSFVTDTLSPLVEMKDRRITEQIIEILAVLGEPYCGKLFSRSPLLQPVSADSAAFLKTAAAFVLHNDLPAALDEMYRLAGEEIPDEWAESYLLLAEYLCAALEYAEGWTMFKKQRAQFLRDQGRGAEAEQVLAELK